MICIGIGTYIIDDPFTVQSTRLSLFVFIETLSAFLFTPFWGRGRIQTYGDSVLERNRQVLGLSRKSVTGYISGDLRGRFWIHADGWWIGVGSRGRISQGRILICEYSTADVVVFDSACTKAFGLRAEPEVSAAGCLVSVNDYIVSLTDTDENPRRIIGNNWYEVFSDNSKVVSIKRDSGGDV